MSTDTLISLSRNGNILGQFPIEAVRAGLRVGKFSPKDYYWTKGMASWKPLDELPAPEPEIPEVSRSEPAEPVTPPAISSAPTAPSSVAPPIPSPPPSPSPSPSRQSSQGTGNSTGHLPPAKPTDIRTTTRTVLLTIGGLLFCYGLLESPTGSALRQQVLVQHMTNGLLFVILALLVKKWD